MKPDLNRGGKNKCKKERNLDKVFFSDYVESQLKHFYTYPDAISLSWWCIVPSLRHLDKRWQAGPNHKR